jgi:autotransporter-associated beta strand protein
VNGLVSTDNLGALVDNKSGSGSYTLTVGGNNGSTYFGGVIANTSGKINLTKTGAGTLTLSQANSFSGNTLVNTGALALSGYATIPNSPLIAVGGGAMLNVAGLTNTFALAASQTLSNSASGTGIVCGNFNDMAGTNSFTYTNGTPCLLVTNGTFTLGSATVFKLNNVGPALLPGNYKLIARAATGNPGNVAGILPAFTVNGVAAGATSSLQFSGGELFLNVTATNSPVLGGIQIAGTNLILTGTNGIAGANYYLLAATNLLLPLTNWTFFSTNQFGAGGNVNLTNPLDPNQSQLFYRLRLP